MMDESQVRAIIQEEVRGIINAFEREKDPFALQNAFIEAGNGVDINDLVDRVKELEAYIDEEPDEQFEVIPETPPVLVLPFLIYLSDGTRFEVTQAQAISGFDPTTHNDWSLEFDVSSSALADYAESGTPAVMTNPLGVSTVNEPVAGEELLHDADASASPSPVAQSYYRLPIIRDGKRVCYGGAFRENTYCSGSKGPVVELLRIS